jgi:nucleotide-binding universal stress UspA family protein
VLHDAHCAVWTDAHAEEQPVWKYMHVSNILCAVDLTEHSDQVIRWALAVARANSSRLRLVHVVQLEEVRAYSYYDATFQRVLAEAASEQLAEVQRKVGIDVESDVKGGDVPKTVRAVALRHKADLVIIGRGHIQAPLGRLRTNAYGIIRESPCPVLSV